MIIRSGDTQKNSQIVSIGEGKNQILHYNLDYDTTRPEETIRKFVQDIRAMVSRYEGNKARIFQVEAELNDLEHYIEIIGFQNVPNGYRLYRKLAELRRERRACKNENDLLLPVWEHFHATEVLNKLTAVQGEIAKCKNAINGYYYRVKTDTLDPWLEEKEEKPEEIPQTSEPEAI